MAQSHLRAAVAVQAVAEVLQATLEGLVAVVALEHRREQEVQVPRARDMRAAVVITAAVNRLPVVAVAAGRAQRE